ncbi:hypothetical protein HF086_006348 [Spodoptera exigua]|uniref:Helicase C-terminal domain-containing protein n=1 Tax=Spodoptera exigua TaxID=7107 RepID=A0A922MQZ5_SPOEX|nr:hypothetical protein HF086_006348 [Spodoptera exigua]
MDEADRMIDMGFEEDVRTIFSYFAVNVGRAGAASLNVRQELEPVKAEARTVHLLQCLQKTPPPVLVFAERKQDVDAIHEYLLLKGVEAVAIHGGKDQEERSRAVEAFRRGEKDVLVATDVASKGLDFANIQHVINYDMPEDIENYVHRIGRTGRAGGEGVPSFLLDMIGEPDVPVPDGQGCSYCGGLGHRITENSYKIAKTGAKRFEPDCVGYPAQTYRLKSPESKNKWRCTSCITKTGSSEENYNAANVTIRKKKYLPTTMTPESKESRSVSDRDLAMLPYSTPSKTVHDTPWSTPKSSVSDQPEYQISAHLHTSFSLNEQTLSRSMDHAALDAINIQEMEESMEQLQSELISTQNKLELTILENNDLRTHVKKLTKENSTLKMLLGHSPNCKQNKNKAHNSMLTPNKTGVLFGDNLRRIPLVPLVLLHICRNP